MKYILTETSLNAFRSDGVTPVFRQVLTATPIFNTFSSIIYFGAEERGAYSEYIIYYNNFEQITLVDSTVMTKSDFPTYNDFANFFLNNVFNQGYSGGGGGSIPSGTYNATTGLTSGGFPLHNGVGTVGSYYVVTVAGTQDFGSGNITFTVGDWVQYSQSLVWVQIAGGGQYLVSFNGRTSANVVPQAGDYTATMVGLGNVPNTNATDLSNDLIVGTFTPTNTAIVTSDDGKTAFQKTQGQINNLISSKANAVPENVSELYVDLQNGSDTPVDPSIIEPFLTLSAALSESTYSTTGAVVHLSKGIVPLTTINLEIGTDGLTIIGQGGAKDTILNAIINSASGKLTLENLTINNITVNASLINVVNCVITGTFTINNNNNSVFFKQVDYSGLENSDFIFIENGLSTANLTIGVDCLGINNISSTSNFVVIRNRMATEIYDGVMSNKQAQKLLYTDSNQWLNTVAEGGEIPIYQKHVTNTNQTAGKSIRFPNYEVPVDGDDFDGDILIITSTPSLNNPYPTTENLTIQAQGGTLVNYMGITGTSLIIEEGSTYSCIYRKYSPTGVLINTIFVE